MGNPNQVAKEPEPTIRHIFTAEIIPNQGRATLSLDIGILPTFSGVQCKQMWIFYALLHLFCLWILCFPTKCIPENIRFASFPHWYGLQCWLQMISREIMFWQQYLWVNSMKEEKKKSIFRVIMRQLFFNSLLKPSAKLQSFHFFSWSWFAILIQIKIPISCPRAKYAITYIYQFQHSVKKIMVSGRRETPNPSEDKCFSLQNVTIGWVQRAWNLQKFCSIVNRYSIQWGINHQ